MKIRLAAPLQKDSVVDGPGIRAVLWTQGCPHHCIGCHNPQTHNFNGGYEEDIATLLREIEELEGQTGITLSGGDPMLQPSECSMIAAKARDMGLDVWCYTGYLFEDILKNTKQLELLKNCDVLVDGKFKMEEFSLNLYYKGSRNQRIIDVKKSLKENKVVLVNKYVNDKNFKIKNKKSDFIFV